MVTPTTAATTAAAAAASTSTAAAKPAASRPKKTRRSTDDDDDGPPRTWLVTVVQAVLGLLCLAAVAVVLHYIRLHIAAMQHPNDRSSIVHQHAYFPDWSANVKAMDKDYFAFFTGWLPGVMSNRRDIRNSLPAPVISPWHYRSQDIKGLGADAQHRLRTSYQALLDSLAALEEGEHTAEIKKRAGAFTQLLDQYVPDVSTTDSVPRLKTASHAAAARVRHAAKVLADLVQQHTTDLLANDAAFEGPTYKAASRRALKVLNENAEAFTAALQSKTGSSGDAAALYNTLSENLLSMIRENEKRLQATAGSNVVRSEAEERRHTAVGLVKEAQRELHSAMLQSVTLAELAAEVEAAGKAAAASATTPQQAFDQAFAHLKHTIAGFRRQLRIKSGEKSFNRTYMYFEADLNHIRNHILNGTTGQQGDNERRDQQLQQYKDRLILDFEDLRRAMGWDAFVQEEFDDAFERVKHVLGLRPRAPPSRISVLRARLV